jgi:hypothetical protein
MRITVVIYVAAWFELEPVKEDQHDCFALARAEVHSTYFPYYPCVRRMRVVHACTHSLLLLLPLNNSAHALAVIFRWLDGSMVSAQVTPVDDYWYGPTNCGMNQLPPGNSTTAAGSLMAANCRSVLPFVCETSATADQSTSGGCLHDGYIFLSHR